MSLIKHSLTFLVLRIFNCGVGLRAEAIIFSCENNFAITSFKSRIWGAPQNRTEFQEKIQGLDVAAPISKQN